VSEVKSHSPEKFYNLYKKLLGGAIL